MYKYQGLAIVNKDKSNCYFALDHICRKLMCQFGIDSKENTYFKFSKDLI